MASRWRERDAGREPGYVGGADGGERAAVCYKKKELHENKTPLVGAPCGAAPIMAEMTEIKLFEKWSCDADAELRDLVTNVFQEESFA